MLGMKSIGGYFPCTSCLHPGGKPIGADRHAKAASVRQVLPEDCLRVKPRTRESFKYFADIAEDKTKSSASKKPCAVCTELVWSPKITYLSRCVDLKFLYLYST